MYVDLELLNYRSNAQPHKMMEKWMEYKLIFIGPVKSMYMEAHFRQCQKKYKLSQNIHIVCQKNEEFSRNNDFVHHTTNIWSPNINSVAQNNEKLSRNNDFVHQNIDLVSQSHDSLSQNKDLFKMQSKYFEILSNYCEKVSRCMDW